MIFHPDSKLLMIGDSITDCGRARLVGDMWPKNALGDGYVSFGTPDRKKAPDDRGRYTVSL